VFVALGIQHAVRHIVICGMPGSTIFFLHYFIKGTISNNKKIVTEHKICCGFLYNFYLKNLILKKIERDIIKIYIGLHVKYSLFL